MVLSDQRKLVDRRDNHRRQVPVYILICNVDRQPVLSTGTCWVLAAVFNEPGAGIIGDGDSRGAKRAFEDSLVFGVEPLSHEAFVEFVVDLVWSDCASNKISNTKSSAL